VPTIDVATQGCDNIKCAMYKTAPRIWVLRVWVLQSRYLGGYLNGYFYLLSTQAITGLKNKYRVKIRPKNKNLKNVIINNRFN
jgi:hypothetical protein